MICPICESQVPDEATFCPQCGTRLDDMPAGATVAQPASTAGQQPYAGQPAPTPYQQPASQTPAPQPASQTPAPQPAKKNILVPILAGVVSMLVVLLGAALFFMLRYKGLAINESNFPDEALRTWVSAHADENGDGYITEVEARKVIVIKAERVTDTKGLENFTNAEQIYLTNSGFTAFDLGQNEFPKLTEIDFTGSKDLEDIDLSKAPNLEKGTFTGTDTKSVVVFDPDRVTFIDLPDGVVISGPNGPVDEPAAATPAEPEKPATITWLMPTSYHGTQSFSDTVYEATSTATYDDQGRLTHMEHVNSNEVGDGSYTETADYSYDDQGRLVHVEVKNGDTFSYQWDLTYSDNSCHASCTNSSGNSDLYIDYTYDDEGRVTACNYYTLSFNGLIEGSLTVSYDPGGRLSSITGTENSAQIMIDATYHHNGHISRIIESDGTTTTTYTYDQDGRLTDCEREGYTPESASYTYGDGPLPTGMTRSAGGSLTSTGNTVQVSVPSQNYTSDYTIEYTEIETPIDVTPLMGIGAIDFTHPNQYGDPWIHATLRPFGKRDILLANQQWLAREEAGATQEGEPAEETQKSSYKCGQMPDGSFVLVGTVNTHRETVGGNEIDVVSMTLDEPVDYSFEYKGNVSQETANEVELASSANDRYDQWRAYDGKHIAVCCYELTMAYHDGSLHNVDSFASEDVYLLE